MKLKADDLGRELKSRGFDFFAGVPCSFLSDLINYAINEADFVMSNNEGDAAAICAGATLAGKKPVVLMQNSGLSNALSPLTSLNYSFRLPVLGFVSLRGEPGLNDEPQHELMGTITEKMLETAGVRWEYLSRDPEIMKAQVRRADEAMARNECFFFIVKKGTLDKVVLKETTTRSTICRRYTGCDPAKALPDNQRPLRLNVLETLDKIKTDDTILLATTGKTGRELYEINDAPNNLYMVGSMGCISAMGLGLALNSRKNTIAIDGDGALLMRMGSMAINGYYAPANLLHILVDNNCHDSTGGQFTVSGNVDFTAIAKACGYSQSLYVESLAELEKEVRAWQKSPELTFIHIKVRKGTKENLGRPAVKPYEVKERLMRFIGK